jgi:hypothetical protein
MLSIYIGELLCPHIERIYILSLCVEFGEHLSTQHGIESPAPLSLRHSTFTRLMATQLHHK